MSDNSLELGGIIHTLLELAVRQYGTEGTLSIPNYRELLTQIPNHTAIYTEIAGDDLVIHVEAVDEKTLALADILEVEGKTFN